MPPLRLKALELPELDPVLWLVPSTGFPASPSEAFNSSWSANGYWFLVFDSGSALPRELAGSRRRSSLHQCWLSSSPQPLGVRASATVARSPPNA